ncbi:SDR family oxidoreductase [bacterium]|jgi:NAD(P)-dependent dehydrogenase (short-subunit alcohol dehydrogenase family)|nr:SDR family oxidoreductase [bacterium]
MKKTILITGANKGIGLELVKRYCHSDNVIAVCRTSSIELDALPVSIHRDIDIRNNLSIKSLVNKINGQKIDLFLNVAGILSQEDIYDLDSAAIDRISDQFEVNALGPVKLVAAFLGDIVDGGKIIMITSRMGSVEDNTSGSRLGYRMSKAALNIASKSLSVDLRPRNISVGIIHPGAVQTDMTNNRGLITVVESVDMILERIKELSLNTSGVFFHASGEILPW